VAVPNDILGLHSKPKAAVHKLMGPKKKKKKKKKIYAYTYCDLTAFKSGLLCLRHKQHLL